MSGGDNFIININSVLNSLKYGRKKLNRLDNGQVDDQTAGRAIKDQGEASKIWRVQINTLNAPCLFSSQNFKFLSIGLD